MNATPTTRAPCAMGRARLAPVVLLAAFAAAGAAGPSDGPLAEWLDASHDELLRQAWLPSERNVHGEFRLLDRRGASCAQTLLYTPSLRRALQRIRKKERRAWPEDREGYADSQGYLDALDAVRDRVLPEPGAAKGLQTMAIEFVLADDVALYALYALDIAKDEDARGGGVRVEALRPLLVREASPAYVSRAIELMRASAFRGQDDDDDDNEDDRQGEDDRQSEDDRDNEGEP